MAFTSTIVSISHFKQTQSISEAAVDSEGVFWQFSEDSSDGSIPNAEEGYRLSMTQPGFQREGRHSLPGWYGIYAGTSGSLGLRQPIGSLYVATGDSSTSTYLSNC